MIVIDIDGQPSISRESEFLCSLASRSHFALDILVPDKANPITGLPFRFNAMEHRHEMINPALRPSKTGLILCSGLGTASPNTFDEPVRDSSRLLAYCDGVLLSCWCGHLPTDALYLVVPAFALTDKHGAWDDDLKILSEMDIPVFVDATVEETMRQTLDTAPFEWTGLPFGSGKCEKSSGVAWKSADEEKFSKHARELPRLTP